MSEGFVNPGEDVHLVGEVVPVLWKKSLHIDHLCSLTLLPLHLVANMKVLTRVTAPM